MFVLFLTLVVLQIEAVRDRPLFVLPVCTLRAFGTGMVLEECLEKMWVSQ